MPELRTIAERIVEVLLGLVTQVGEFVVVHVDRSRPVIGRLGLLEFQLLPGVEVDLLDGAVEVLDLHGGVGRVDGHDLEEVAVLVLVPVAYGRGDFRHRSCSQTDPGGVDHRPGSPPL